MSCIICNRLSCGSTFEDECPQEGSSCCVIMLYHFKLTLMNIYINYLNTYLLYVLMSCNRTCCFVRVNCEPCTRSLSFARALASLANTLDPSLKTSRV